MTRCIHVKIIKNVVPMLIAPEVPNRNHYLLSSGKLAKKCNLRARVSVAKAPSVAWGSSSTVESQTGHDY